MRLFSWLILGPVLPKASKLYPFFLAFLFGSVVHLDRLANPSLVEHIALLLSARYGPRPKPGSCPLPKPSGWLCVSVLFRPFFPAPGFATQSPVYFFPLTVKPSCLPQFLRLFCCQRCAQPPVGNTGHLENCYLWTPFPLDTYTILRAPYPDTQLYNSRSVDWRRIPFPGFLIPQKLLPPCSSALSFPPFLTASRLCSSSFCCCEMSASVR